MAPADEPAWFVNDPGSAYVFHGGPSGLSVLSDWHYVEGVAASGFGTSLDAAGDVDADGYADVVRTLGARRG